MSIIYHKETKVFHLHNDAVSYIMMVLPNGQMGHLYYGKKIHDREDFGDLLETAPRPMSFCTFEGNKAFSLEHIKHELPVYGTGDYRSPAVEVIQENGILKTQIFALASISQKREEAGIKEWCRRENIPFLTYSAEELRQVDGEFTASAFVEKQVGVDNVCERAALKACEETAAFGPGGAWQGNGTLVLPKCAGNGMTIAIAKREWRVHFYGE